MIQGALLAVALLSPANVTPTASPTRVALTGAGRQVVQMAAAGARLPIEVSVRGYALDLRGRPRIAPASVRPVPWLTVSPRRLTVTRLPARITLRSAPPRGARPGDHLALVLLTASAPSKRGVLTRMRIGIVVRLRVRGPFARRIELRGLAVRRAGRARLLELTLANTGAALESIKSRELTVTLRARGRVLARLRPGRRDLLPHSRGLVVLRYGGRARGTVAARVELGHPGVRRVSRLFRLRL
jgi:hypothetical protein